MMGTRIASFLKENGWVLNLSFILLGAYFVAGASNAVVARGIRVIPSIDDVRVDSRASGGLQSSRPSASVDSIAERNLLGAEREAIGPVVSLPTDATLVAGTTFNEKELKPCTMTHTVRATLVAEGAPEWSMAVVYNNTTREAEVYNTSDGFNQIADDAVLVDVRDRAVVVRRRDHFEICSCEGDEPIAASPLAAARARTRDEGGGDEGGVSQVSETQYTVERTEVDNALANLSQVATQARIVPSFKNGKPNGFKLFSIKPGSIYSKIGLKNGDVIQKINGYEMNSPDKALELYQKLKDASSVSIELQRRGQTKNFSYSIQ